MPVTGRAQGRQHEVIEHTGDVAAEQTASSLRKQTEIDAMVEQAAQQRAAAAVLLADARAESARVAAQAQRRERLSKERTAQAELEATARARSVAVEERAGVLRQAEVQVEELVAAAAQRAADEREAVLREAGPSCAPISITSTRGCVCQVSPHPPPWSYGKRVADTRYCVVQSKSGSRWKQRLRLSRRRLQRRR